MNKQTQRILGIDPGFGRVGFGIIEGARDHWQLVEYGLIETNADIKFVDRLFDIVTQINFLIQQHQPTRAGVELLYFSKNQKTAMQVAEARGVILFTLYQAGLAVDDCTPLQVKQTLTGYGNAEKQQVQKMVAMQLGLGNAKLQDDAADALAVALTCGFRLAFEEKTKRSADF